MREMLIGAAKAGAFTPLWSDRVFEEWRRAALRHGPGAGVEVQGECALLNASFPSAAVKINADQEARFWLPDPADIHVIAGAVIGSADGIVTLNNKDFPAQILAEEQLSRVNPDALLLGFWHAHPELITGVAIAILDNARKLSCKDWRLGQLLKKAQLHRLALAVDPK